jgi:signal transduction histidine kinase
MNVRTKIFLLLSVVLLCSISLYVWISARMDHQRLVVEFDKFTKNVERAFRSEQDSVEMQMLQIATLVAHDEKVKQLFLLGKRAVELEGGGAGGELSDQVRKSLFEHVQQSQKGLAAQFGFRQLHFHFGPGSLSFLRVHRPEKFGDRMDQVRYTIVAANAEQKNTMGFETGRILSGIRGVTPVVAIDGGSKEKVHVGALEAGTSFSNMLSIFQKNRPWLDVAVLLRQEHLEANLWPDFLEKLLEENQFIEGFRVESTTSPQIGHFLTLQELTKNLQGLGSFLIRDEGASYNFSVFPLRDFRGESNAEVPDAGRVVVWQDITAQITAYHDRVYRLIFYGFLLFISIELLIFFGLGSMTKSLQAELERTRYLKAASEQARLVAEDSSRLKSEFLGNISHELRTPMNAIMGLGQLLGKSPLEPRQQGFIDKINLSSKRLMNVIDEIMLLTELDAQEGKDLISEKFNLLQLMNRVTGNFAARANEQRVRLKTDFSDGLPSWVNGWPAQLERILGQLLGNAIKFGHDGDVTLAVRLLDRDAATATLEFAITDQGIGISAEQQELMFQPFQQGDGSRTRKYEGTGLGLTIARKACRQLGGDITVDSRIGEGSRFSFCLKFEVFADAWADPLVAALELPTAAAETVSSAAQPIATFAEIGELVDQLEEPLARLEAKQCQDIAASLKEKQWPETLNEELEKLTILIGQYRFVEARDVVNRLKDKL